jgi:ubiquinone/menaquinone biosynthesis C-methylase UbiE
MIQATRTPISRPVSTEKDAAYHDVIGGEYDTVVVAPRSIINDRVFEVASRHVRTGRGALDLGCGTGHATLRFGHLFAQIVAVDHSRTMLAQADANFRKAGITNVTTRLGQLREFLPTQPAQSADAAFTIGFLHHLSEADIAWLYGELARTVRPGGQILLSEPRQIGHAPPAAISDWNAKSIAPTLAYSRHADEPDEQWVDEPWLIENLYQCGFALEYISHHWEIFPKNANPGRDETHEMLRLHDMFGHTGNAVTMIAHRSP